MLDVCLLGTGGMMPLPRRYLTSLAVRYKGMSVLIDCGEGTQMALREKGWSPNPIGMICFTHYHADHISGLPGMLLNMGNAERTEPLVIVGPKGLERVVGALRVIAPELPFEIEYHELKEAEERIALKEEGGFVRAFRVNHNVTCYGYNIEIERKGRFNAEAAKRAGIPVKCWNRLQHGQTVCEDGCVYTPDMVMGEDRKGLKLTYTTDTRPTESIVKNASGADLFICEGMYGEKEKEANARAHKHMMFYEAAELAAKAGVKEMWLTHYSPALIRPEPFMDEVRAVFANSHAGKDGKSTELKFEDEAE
ncbi:MAG: ribonuclease Z [Lachnospiraceae bacterium]|nr:ribonuclease Z [Lachnospiraceae bacterium]